MPNSTIDKLLKRIDRNNAYWRELVKLTPQLSNDETRMKITVREFRKRIQRAFESGWDGAKADNSPFERMFGDM